MVLRAFAVAAVALLCSCVQVPYHDGAANVRLDEIVKLLKCDLAYSIREKVLEGQALDPTNNRFAFLAEWAAKVRLTVAVDNQVSVNPGATLIEPLTAATSRSLGLGAGLTTQAVSQKDIEFFLSFQDIGREFLELENGPGLGKYNGCKPADGLLLESDLHLKAILDTALKPVAEGILVRGAPAISTSPTLNVAAAGKSLDNYLKLALADRPRQIPPNNTPFNDFLNPTLTQKQQTIEKLIGKAEADKVKADEIEAEKIEKEARAIVTNIVTPLYEIASVSLPRECLNDKDKLNLGITSNKNNAVVMAALVSAAKIDVDQAQNPSDSEKALKTEKESQRKTINAAKTMIKLMDECTKRVWKKPSPAVYDPITTIGETVNFYITSSASIAPTLKLVRVSAPYAPSLLSGNRKDTNTIIIAMGRPDIKDGKVVSSAAMDQQVLSSLLGQAIVNAPR